MAAVLKIYRLESTKFRLQRLEAKTTKRSFRRAQKGAKDIVKLAKLLTPIKSGDLENSISMHDIKRTGSGRGWRRVQWEILADPNKLDLARRKGYKYHEKMHDSDYHLGRLSQLKAYRVRGAVPGTVKKGSDGTVIGTGYVRRSVKYHEKFISRDLRAIMKDEARNF